MDEALGANVADLTRALQRKGVPLPHEVGTFIALEVANALVVKPCAVSGTTVFVNGQGQVAVADAKPAEEVAAVRCVLMLLGELLVASAPGVPESLLELVEEAQNPRRARTLKALRDELEAALVPLNRSATMRILGRIARDAFGNQRMRGPTADGRSAGEVTSAIDAMLGVDSQAADALRTKPEQGGATPAERSATPREPTIPASDPRLTIDVERMDDRPGRGSRLALLAVLFVVIAGAVAYFVRRSSASQVHSSVTAAQRAPQVPSETAAPAAPKTSSGKPTSTIQLGVDSTPRGAQVLLKLTDGEVFVDPRVSHEFVAIASDGRVVRAVLGPQQGSLALEPDPAAEVASVPHLGPSKLVPPLAATVGHLEARLVTLSAPQGAALYKLVGFTPTTLQIDGSAKLPSLLLYREGFALSPLAPSGEQWARVGSGEGRAPHLPLHVSLSPQS